jgi:hypothetical protein
MKKLSDCVVRFTNFDVSVTSQGKKHLALILGLVTDNGKPGALSADLTGGSLVLYNDQSGSPLLFKLSGEALVEYVWAFLASATYPEEPVDFGGMSGKGWKVATVSDAQVLCIVTPTLALFHK